MASLPTTIRPHRAGLQTCLANRPIVGTGALRPFAAILFALLVFGSIAVLTTPEPLWGSERRVTPVVRAVRHARDSIVNICGQKTITSTSETSGEIDVPQRVNGMGTGIVIDERGYIATNYHVIDGVARIQVTLADHSRYTARLISHDPKTDLAVIKIDLGRKRLLVIDFGISSDLMPGEPVIAVGNAYGYEHTVTRGIISALGRTVQISDAQSYHDLIQTDASINPGNSGGPLLNIDGEMIGINVAVRVGAQGIGFALPVDKVLEVCTDLVSAGRVGGTWHGVVMKSTGHDDGIVVVRLEKDSPAAKSGLKVGDRIKSVGGRKVERAIDLERALLEKKTGDRVELDVRRGKNAVDVSFALTLKPKRKRSSPDRTWEVLGLRLKPIPEARFRQYSSRYHGGLMITDVRPDSPARAQGIRPGDVLVGMHIWEIVSVDNLTYVLGRDDLAELEPLKFYILRGSQTLYGYISLAGN